MNAPASHFRFLLALSAFFGATLLPVVILNYLLISKSVGDGSQISLASQWQEATRGTVMIGGISALDSHRLYKALRLHDRLSSINTLILGSSTAMGMSQAAFPEPFRIYNFASNSNELFNVIAEADHIQKAFTNVKWLLIPLDWSVGFLYSGETPPTINLSLEEVLARLHSESMSVSTWAKLRDSISYPKIVNLARVGREIAGADEPRKAFLGFFSLSVTNEYRCPDGSPARDFDTMFLGRCAGFRFDGSATFNHLPRVDRWKKFDIRSARDPNFIYSKHLRRTGGMPNAMLLERLATIAKRARENGGRATFLLPPLLPGLEAEIRKDPVLATALGRTKSALAAWASANNLTLIDAGESERFGCTTHEFIDMHHAVESCYRKILGPSLARAGLVDPR